MPGLGRSFAAILAAALVMSLAPAAPAAAASLCGEGSGAGQCSEPQGLAVDTETGRTYVADEGNDRVDVFDEAGTFLPFFGGGVLSGPTSVAVDNDPSSSAHHDVFAVDFGNRRIARFDDEGHLLNFIGEGEYEDSSGPERTDGMLVAVGPDVDAPLEADSELYVVDVRRTSTNASGECVLGEGGGTAEGCLTTRLRRYAPGGGAPLFEDDIATTERSGAVDGNLRGLAVDSAGDSYIRTGSPGESLCKYDPAGTPIAGFRDAGCFPASETPEAQALALDREDNLYAWGIDRDADGSRYQVIAQYDPAGAPLHRFGYLPGIHQAAGLTMRPDAPLAPGAPFYASLGEEVRIIPFPDPGPLALGPEASGVTSFKATLAAEVNPEGKATDYRVEYVPATLCEEDEAELGPGHCFDQAKSSEEEELEIEGETPAEEEEELYRLNHAPATVGCLDPENEAALPESPCLEAETEYRWRLLAANADSPPGEPATLDGGSFETTEPLEITDLWATAVGADSATLHATVNPLGVPASGWFEYVTESEFKASGFATATRVPAGTAELDFGAEAETSRAASVSGLEEDTAYRFRFLATNPLLEAPIASEEADSIMTFPPAAPLGCASEGARGGLAGARTGAGAFLPDCRAYELVSPVDKNNADVAYPYTSNGRPARLEQSSTDGGRLAYNAQAAFAEPEGAPWSSQYIAARHAGAAWQSHAISSPRKRALVLVLKQADTEFEAFSPDLCQGWLRSFAEPPLTAEGIEGAINLYRRTDEDCGGKSYEALTTIAPPHFTGDAAGGSTLELQGASADGARAIYSINDTLEGTGAPAQPGECSGESPGKCEERLYSRSAAEGTRYVCVLPGGAAASSCGAGTYAGGGILIYHRQSNVENAISADGNRVFWSAPAPGEGEIYMRDSKGTATAADDETKAVSAGGEALSGTSKSRFVCAAADGAKAVYRTGSDLYEFYPDEGITHEIAAGLVGVYGVAGCSQDAATVYFASSEAIAGAGVNSEGAKAIEGEPNLYRYRAAAKAGDPGAYAFIATLAGADTAGAGPLAVEPEDRLSRVSPSGGAVAFMSRARLTGYDATDAATGEADMELFVYDAGSRELSCAGCNPTGGRPVGDDPNREFEGAAAPRSAAWIPAWESVLYAPRALSDSGRRLFFESSDRLAARDTNGRTDVYQWEAAGEGTCTASSPSYAAANEGCVELISSGQANRDVELRDASPSGEDVFFATVASLLPQDYGLVDIYDARVGGGLPVPEAPPPPCEGEACQSPPPAPEAPAPASSAFRGPGNPAPPSRCAVAAKRAKRSAGNAKRLRRGARRAARAGAAKQARRKARRARALGKRARRLSRNAKRCRRRARAARRAAR